MIGGPETESYQFLWRNEQDAQRAGFHFVQNLILPLQDVQKSLSSVFPESLGWKMQFEIGTAWSQCE
jgi:hypothetical protein